MMSGSGFPVGRLEDAVATGDFNDDGKIDVVAAGGGNLSVLLGHGDGTFQAAQSYSPGGVRANSVAVADFNGDHKLDLLVANSNNSGLLLGNGDGTFQAAQSYNVGGPSVAVGHFNHDGRPDAALAGTVVLLNITHRSK